MKQFVISHVKDVDGVSPLILMNLTGQKYEYQLLDVHEVETFMMEFLTRDLSSYEHIYIVDLTVPKSIYEKIESSDYKNKFLIFDHHATHLFATNYSYVTINTEECGTTLFYTYLLTQKLENTQALNEYVTSVKHLDLWTFLEYQDLLAPKLGMLFERYGEKRYVEEMTRRLSEEKQHFCFNSFETELLKLEEESQKRYIDKRELRMKKAKVCGYQAGIVFAEKYRSELGNALLLRHPEIDFVMIINMNGGISLRSREINVSKIAEQYGGGGHPHAAGIGIPNEQITNFLMTLWKGEILFEDNETNSRTDSN